MTEAVYLVQTVRVHVGSHGLLCALGIGPFALRDFRFVGTRKLDDVFARKLNVDGDVASETGKNFVDRFSAEKGKHTFKLTILKKIL